MEVSARIRQFIIENFLFNREVGLEEDTSFLENGIIDSTGVLELIDFLEKTFDIKIEDHEIIPENLDSICKAVRFIHNKRVLPAKNQTPSTQKLQMTH